MKKILYITIAIFFTAQMGCKKEPEKFKIKGRIMDGTTGQRFKGLTFTVHTKGGTANKIIGDLGSFTTNDSGDFEFLYEKIKGINSNSISIISNFMKFENLSINQNVEKVFYKSTIGRYIITCNCPNIKTSDTLFLEYARMSGVDLVRDIDTIVNVKNGDNFTYSRWPQESITLRWGINSNTFSWNYYQGNVNIINYLGTIRGKVTGDPIIDEFEIKY
ncbi:MAG: hypothetical protein IT243_02620 [Bacteroidia bacterium]|nr:hypothetical protein [Bacteroidia bacterium]